MSCRLSKKTYFLGVKAWELMGLIVGLEIREVNYMILLSHKLSVLEEIKEIRIDPFCDSVSDFILILVLA